jgi:hypothetical protein
MGCNHIFTLAETALCTLALADDVVGIPFAIRYPVCTRAMKRYRALEAEIDTVDLADYNAMQRTYRMCHNALACIDIPNMMPLPDPAAAWQFPIKSVTSALTYRMSKANLECVSDAVARLAAIDITTIVGTLERLGGLQAHLGAIEDNLCLMLAAEDIDMMVAVVRDEDRSTVGKRQRMASIMMRDYDRLQRTSTTSSWVTTVMAMMEYLKGHPYAFVITDIDSIELSYKKLKFSRFASQPRFTGAAAIGDRTVIEALMLWIAENDPLALAKMYFS